jgi:hypothetical protein
MSVASGFVGSQADQSPIESIQQLNNHNNSTYVYESGAELVRIKHMFKD